jgi:uncharacterized protein YndB with AHSA1/START domain
MVTSVFHYVTYIRTTPQKLWAALTTAEVIRQYWFGTEVEGDWREGTTWKFYNDGSLMDSGEIVESLPRQRLVRTWQNEWRPEFKAEGRSRCTYEMKQFGTVVKLTVTHSMERANSKFIDAVSAGWPMCLSNLKSLLETGEIALAEHPGHED